MKDCCKKRKKDRFVYCDICGKKLIPEYNLITNYVGGGFTGAGSNSNKK